MFKLKLKNYRGFQNEEFDFSRVNILIGENSAGKSSIFKFLLALKQSLRTPNNRDYNLTLAGDTNSGDTDLGNYQEVIYNHEVDRNLSFSFEFKKDYFEFFMKDTFNLPIELIEDEKLAKKIADEKKNITEYLGGEIIEPTVIEFELSNDLSSHKNIKTKIENNSIGLVEIIQKQNLSNEAEQDIYLIGNTPKCDILFHSKSRKNDILLKDIEYEKEAFLTIISGDKLKEQIKKQLGLKKKNEVEKIYWQIGFLLIIQNYIQLQLSSIEYINPLLSKTAERIYLESDRKNTKKVRDVKDLVDYISTNNTKPKFKEDLSKILSDFGIASTFHIKKEGFTRELRVIFNGLDNNIKDVGFGVSLQLPIFAQAIISEATNMTSNGVMIKNGQTLLIEQPEVHLHPKLQAKFVDALLQIGPNNVYFIETHSEHIVRMLQVLVKEKKYDLKTDDISIHYLRKEDKKMVKTKHSINSETGKLIPNFPKGFYDISYDLAFQLID